MFLELYLFIRKIMLVNYGFQYLHFNPVILTGDILGEYKINCWQGRSCHVTTEADVITDIDC